MRHEPQKTTVSIVCAAVEEWRQRERRTRESIALEIVEVHERINGPALTGIEFDSGSKDTFRRAKVFAERIYRWLDDVTKDCTLLPTNFILSILAALPSDLQLQCLGQILRPLGLEVCRAGSAESLRFDPAARASSLIKEGGEAAVQILSMGPNPSPSVIEKAIKEVTDVKNCAESMLPMLHELSATATKH